MKMTDAEIERLGITLLLFHGVIIMAEVYLLWESHQRREGNGGATTTSSGTPGGLQTPLF